MSFDSINSYLHGVTPAQASHIDSVTTHEKTLSTENSIINYYKLKNLKLTINDSGKLSVKGSLAKFYNGNNIQPFFLDDAGYAIESISDLLKVPFGESTLTRADFGSNFVMDHDPSLYQNCILSASRLNRVVRDDTLYLENKSKKQVFYNKFKEAHDKNMFIPEPFYYENLFRHELCLLGKKKIENSLQYENPTVGLLSDCEFTERMVNLYLDEFKKIKFRPEVLKLDRITEPSEAKKLLFELLISKEEPQVVEDYMNTIYELIDFKHGNYKTRLKDMVYNTDNKLIDSSPLVDELTRKVESVREMFACPAII